MDVPCVSTRSPTHFKVKAQVRVCEMWTATCIEEVCEGSTNPQRSFVMGWPTCNSVAMFRYARTHRHDQTHFSVFYWKNGVLHSVTRLISFHLKKNNKKNGKVHITIVFFFNNQCQKNPSAFASIFRRLLLKTHGSGGPPLVMSQRLSLPFPVWPTKNSVGDKPLPCPALLCKAAPLEP